MASGLFGCYHHEVRRVSSIKRRVVAAKEKMNATTDDEPPLVYESADCTSPRWMAVSRLDNSLPGSRAASTLMTCSLNKCVIFQRVVFGENAQ